MKPQIKLTLSLCLALCLSAVQAQNVATFEDLNLEAESYWDGTDGTGSFVSGDYQFINNFTDWGDGYTSWDGFAYSNSSSTQYESLDDQYNCCIGKGCEESQTYGVVYYSSYMGTEPTVKAADGNSFEAKGCYVTNAAYAYTSMKNGDAYAKQFDDTDWFLITATGYLANEVTGTAEFYLAQNGNILDTWQLMDLSALGIVDEIHFILSSSDTGVWGMNTPAYFCIDNFGTEINPEHLNSITNSQSSTRNYDILGRTISSQKGLFIQNGKLNFTK